MTEDLDKKAWEVFRNALANVDLPSYVTVNENEDGSFSFLLTLTHKNSGYGLFYYKPSIEVIKGILTDLSKGKINVFGERLSQKIAGTFATSVAYSWLNNFHLEFAISFLDLPKIPLLTLLISMQETLDEYGEQRLGLTKERENDAHAQVKELIARKARSIEARIYSESKEFLKLKSAQKKLIAYFYPSLHKKWKEAKNCYETNKNFKNWQKMVEVAFEELPVELIERLSDADSYTASPSAIALEHAALICGIDVQSVGLRTLQNYLKESRQWIKQVGEEKADDEAKKYLDQTVEQLVQSFHIAYLMGAEVPKEKLTFIEKELLTDDFEKNLIRVIKKFEDEMVNSEKQGEV